MRLAAVIVVGLYSYPHLLVFDHRESVLPMASVVDTCRRGEAEVCRHLVVVAFGRRLSSVRDDRRLVSAVESGCDLEVRGKCLLLCTNLRIRCVGVVIVRHDSCRRRVEQVQDFAREYSLAYRTVLDRCRTDPRAGSRPPYVCGCLISSARVNSSFGNCRFVWMSRASGRKAHLD